MDAVLLVAAWRAAEAGDDAALDEVARSPPAWRGTAELALESTRPGQRLHQRERRRLAGAGASRPSRPPSAPA